MTHEIAQGEETVISVWTRSTAGAKFTVTDADKRHLADGVEVIHSGTSDVHENPSSMVITSSKIVGPAKLKVKGDAIGSRWSTNNFLVVFSVS